MSWWKNLIQDAVLIGLMFTGFIIIHKNALQQETTKITQHIDQKFKKTGTVNTMPTMNTAIGQDSCISWSQLSKREKRYQLRKLSKK